MSRTFKSSFLSRNVREHRKSLDSLHPKNKCLSQIVFLITKFGKKAFNIRVKKVNFITMFTGLMFKSRETKNLLFDFAEDTQILLHSWFVFFNFYVLWLDEKNKVIEFKEIRPFTTIISCRSKFRKIVEIPINKENRKIINFLVGKRKI